MELRPPRDGEEVAQPQDLHGQPPTGTAGRNLVYGAIAQGGMGAVLRGRDPLLGRELAVKVLLEEHRGNPELTRRFVEEAQIAGQLQHPGIVPVYELGTFEDRRPFFTMKLVKGRTLATLLGGRSSPGEDLGRFLGIFEQVCQTVAYAHARGVIHRDLKPSNVMVGAFGEVQVMDWGLAKVLNRGAPVAEGPAPAPERTHIRTLPSASTADAQRVGTLLGMGTFGYMPPEQALGEADLIDERADVFALGAMLCEILTGKPPYVGTQAEVRRQTARGDLAGAFTRLDGSGAADELSSLCKRCLAPRLEERPRDAGQVAVGVTAYLAGVAERLRAAELARAAAQARAEEEAKARTLAEQVAGHERRTRRLTGALAALVVLIALVGGVGGVWLKSQADARAAARARRQDEIRGEVQRHLQEVAAYRQQAPQLTGDPDRWQGALTAARRTAQEAGRAATAEAAPDDLTPEVNRVLAELDEDEKDLEMVKCLARVRAESRTMMEGRFDRSAAAYQEVFRDYGLDPEKSSPAQAAHRVLRRLIADELLVGLNDWATAQYASKGKDDPLFKWISEVPLHTDPQALQEVRRVIDAHAATARGQAPPISVVPPDSEFAGRNRHQRLKLAFAYRATGNQAALEALLRYELGTRPQDYEATAGLAFFLAAEAKPPRFEEAAAYLTAAAALRPRDEMTYLLLAETLIKLKDYRRVEHAFRKALAVNPKNAYAHNGLGIALLHQDRHGDAVVAIEEAIRLEPDNPGHHFSLSTAQLARGKRAEALTAMRKAVQLDPKNLAYHRFLANHLRDAKQFGEAVAEYNLAIAGNREDHEAYLGLGLLFEQQGDKARALEAFRKAVAVKPNEPLCRQKLGLFFLGEGQWEQAARELQTLVKLKPGDKGAVDLLRLVYTSQGARLSFRKPAESAAAFRKALDLQPDDSASWTALGNALLFQGKKGEARAAFRKALDINPRDGISRFQLGLLGVVNEDQEAVAEWSRGDQLWQRGNYKDASAAYQKVVEMKPNWAAAYWNLASSYQGFGELTKAQDTLKRFREFGPPSSQTADERLRTLERLIEWDRKLPTLAAGEKPGETDRAALAGLCLLRQYPGTAVRLYAEAFAAKADLGAQGDGTRYNAARAAVLAAAGQGKDAAKLDDKERTRLRKQAFNWLKADLAVWTRQAEGTDAQARTIAQRKMEGWQSDADLAGVRDQGSLEKLSKEERDEWRKLWADVGEVLKKARK